MRILLLSAYDAASHKRWRNALVAHLDEHQWSVETMAPRHFAWRSRGNSLHFGLARRELLAQPYDALITTSMTDLASLRGFVPELSRLPTAVYFHENQFEYPLRSGQRANLDQQLTSLYTALCGDRLLFNSAFNRDSFLKGAGLLLAAMPDHVPPGIVNRLRERAQLLAVPLEAKCYAARGLCHGPLSIVWNHRWEYDKAPERFFEALFQLSEHGYAFDLHVVGQSFRQVPPVFEQARERLASHIRTWGFLASVEAYRELLSTADLVVSTALHEFQGLAVLEAVAAGCRPLVPDRLAYREFIPEPWRYGSYPDEPAREVAALVEALRGFCNDPESLRRSAPVNVEALSWNALAPGYRALLAQLVRGG
ncbi:MAG: DUF3524 domain-containing protein [Bradymonadaceae bacterium]|nr:DUF3524 domain-containing protein [Lujinxingiaceae bacterium]